MIYLEMAIVAGEIAGLVFSVEKHGWLGQFVYYTQCSNYFLLIAAVIYLVYLLRRRPVPASVELFRYIAACLTTVTFLVTVCILIPWYGHPGFFLLETNGLFQHLLCPILAVAGLPFLRRKRKRDAMLALIPTVIYGVILYTLNIFQAVSGPYPFLKVYEQPWYMSVVWFFVLLAMSFGIATMLMKSPHQLLLNGLFLGAQLIDALLALAEGGVDRNLQAQAVKLVTKVNRLEAFGLRDLFVGGSGVCCGCEIILLARARW